MLKIIIRFFLKAILLFSFGSTLVACASNAQADPEGQANGPVITTAIEAEDQALAGQGSVEADSELEPVISTASINWNEDGLSVKDAVSTLVRMKHGIYTTFETKELEPNDAYTIWWVIFNNPENCSGAECGPDDIFLADEEGELIKNEAGASVANQPGREATGASVLRATGTVVDQDGRASFRAHLPVADTTEASFGPGLVEPMGAEIHLIARSHGQAIPGQLHEQLNTSWGGCPDGWPKDPCGDNQVSVHQP